MWSRRLTEGKGDLKLPSEAYQSISSCPPLDTVHSFLVRLHQREGAIIVLDSQGASTLSILSLSMKHLLKIMSCALEVLEFQCFSAIHSLCVFFSRSDLCGNCLVNETWGRQSVFQVFPVELLCPLSQQLLLCMISSFYSVLFLAGGAME